MHEFPKPSIRVALYLLGVFYPTLFEFATNIILDSTDTRVLWEVIISYLIKICDKCMIGTAEITIYKLTNNQYSKIGQLVQYKHKK